MKYSVIVIGAGISGLSFAHYCAKAGLNSLVLEKDDHAGGAIHSHTFSGDAQGFWLEMGAHTCYNSYGNLIGILEDLGLTNRIIPRERVSFRMFVDNEIQSIPSQLNFPELLLNAPRIFLLKKEGSSVESYYSRIVGKRNYKRVFGPAFNAVISQRADDFPADTLFKKRPRRKDILKSFTFPGGVQTITDTIASQSGIIVLKSKEVREIRYGYNLFALRTADGERFETEALALATPASVSAELLRSAFPALAEKISFIETHPVESAGVALKRGLVSLRPLAGLIPVDDSFHSVVSRDTVKDDQFRGFCFHFKPHRRDNNEKLQRISEVLKVELDQITHIMSKRNIVPSLKGGHDALVNDIDGLLSGKPLFLTGNYFSGLAIEECVTRSLTEYRRMKDTASGSYPCDSI